MSEFQANVVHFAVNLLCVNCVINERNIKLVLIPRCVV